MVGRTSQKVKVAPKLDQHTTDATLISGACSSRGSVTRYLAMVRGRRDRDFARLIPHEQVCATQDNDLDPDGCIVYHAPRKEVCNDTGLQH